ncbi:M15 family metallopeptidase [Streptomyces sp. NPDC002144]|uniref:M15 family metallopeptidase n=1 Tax=Streptomyces sp. NPDC006668 TaxID=3156903 RepID=UPI0033ED8785
MTETPRSTDPRSTTPRSTHTPPRRIHRLLAVVLAVVVLSAVIAALCYQLPRSASSSFSSHASLSAPRRGGHGGALGEADGVVPDGVTVFDDTVPAVAKLDPDLLRALRRAATDAGDDGLEFRVNSGWRSPAYQNRLFGEAVAKYGSETEAARWVATAATSPHVSGDAVDIGPSDATAWLSEHGAAYGLCRIYRNEPWHYELRTEAVDDGCPHMYADPTQDPRMQK